MSLLADKVLCRLSDAVCDSEQGNRTDNHARGSWDLSMNAERPRLLCLCQQGSAYQCLAFGSDVAQFPFAQLPPILGVAPHVPNRLPIC